MDYFLAFIRTGLAVPRRLVYKERHDFESVAA